MSIRLGAAGAGMALAVLATGCSGGAGHPSNSSAASAPTNTSAVYGVTWQRRTDSVSKISFELPGKITTSTQPGAGPQGQKYQIRAYTGAINDYLGCTVSVETALSGTLYIATAAQLAQTYVTQFESAGATDAQATTPTPISIDGHSGDDFRLTFTSADGAAVVWLFTIVNEPTAQVITQSFSSGGSATPDTFAQLNTQLTGSLQLP
jgi:hypothetical protein